MIIFYFFWGRSSILFCFKFWGFYFMGILWSPNVRVYLVLLISGVIVEKRFVVSDSKLLQVWARVVCFCDFLMVPSQPVSSPLLGQYLWIFLSFCKNAIAVIALCYVMCILLRCIRLCFLFPFPIHYIVYQVIDNAAWNIFLISLLICYALET